MIITFEFSIERGVVNAEDMQEEESGNLKKCLDLCKEGRHEEAVTLLMSHIRFEWDCHRRYCLVQDKDTLLMLKLRLGEGIGKVYKYVLSDK